MTNLDAVFRKLPLDKLEAIQTIAEQNSSVLTTTTISGLIQKKGRKLGGTLSSLYRTKIDDEPLILPVGKTEKEGVLWRLNDKIASKDEVKAIVDQIFTENIEYRQSIKNK